ATLFSRLMGLVREMLIARYYGSSGQTDSFFYALIIPELLRTLMVSGAVASIYIPLMTQIQRSGKVEEAKKLAGIMLSFVSLLAIVIVIGGEFAAPWLVKASEVLSFAKEPLDPARFALTTELIRIFLPVVFLVSLWGLMGGILNTLDNFHVPGLAPIAWNGTIIVILVIFGRRGDVHDVAWAFVIAHAIQVLFHVPALAKSGIWPMAIDWKHPMLRQFLALAPAALLAYAAQSVNAFVGQGIALNLSESAASSLAYAFRIQQLPMAIFGVSVATALFPTLSRHAASGSGKEVVRSLASGIRMTALAVIPVVVFIIIFPQLIIEILLQRGAFTSRNTDDVALALSCYSWGILPMSFLLLTARTFFSEKDIRTPAILGVASILLNYFLCLGLSRSYGFAGIAVSTVSVAWIIFVLSAVIINIRHRKEISFGNAIGLLSPIQMIIAGAAQAGALMIFGNFFHTGQSTLTTLVLLLIAAVVGAAVYLGLLKLMNNRDLSGTLNRLLRR
ncbi:MAG: murein biosynthesis integral membrane protein MurJ, partial [bacterium]